MRAQGCAWRLCPRPATHEVHLVRGCCGKLLQRSVICTPHAAALQAEPVAAHATVCVHCGESSQPRVLWLEPL